MRSASSAQLSGLCWGGGDWCNPISHAWHATTHFVSHVAAGVGRAWSRYHKVVGNWVGRVAGYGAYLPGGVGTAFGALSLAGYAAAYNWREVRAGTVGLLAGVVGGRLLKRAGEAAWGFRGASRVTRSRVVRGIRRYEWFRGTAYNLMTSMN